MRRISILLPDGKLIEVAKTVVRSRASASGDRSVFEEILHNGIMVVTQAAHDHALPVSLKFASDIVVLAAVAGLQREIHCKPTAGAWYGNGVKSPVLSDDRK